MRKLLIILFLFLSGIACHRNITDVTVNADFTYEILDNDYSIPVRISITNTSSGAQFFHWTFEGGIPATYDQREPGYIQFDKPGPIKIKLEAWNDEERKEKEITILLDSVVKAGFTIQPVINNFGPTQFAIANISAGVTKFNWIFENGQPASSTDKNPVVLFNNAGQYHVKLQVSNDRGEKDTISKTVTVLPALDKAEFNIVPSFDDEDDYEAPLIAKLENHTSSATTHKWTATGGHLNNSVDTSPVVTYNTPGTYTITYEATNGKQTKTATRTITVKPNSGMRSFSNIQLGINTAHGSIGSFFSTRLRRVFTKDDINTTNGPKIDIAFFGLSESFNFNEFISPDSAQSWTFSAIPGATHTRLVNLQEQCACGAHVTGNDFDKIKSGNDMQSLPVIETPAGTNAFNSGTVPRIVLFQNADGKKGLIKIKQFVQAGQQSYIVCDIKVQKD